MTAIAAKQPVWISGLNHKKSCGWIRAKVPDARPPSYGVSSPSLKKTNRTYSQWNIGDLRNASEAEFQQLASRWKSDTMFISSVQDRVLHPAYQRIIGLGRPVLPFLLRDMEINRTDWFWALRSITGQDPVPESSRGKRNEMIDAWLAWAEHQPKFEHEREK